MQNVAMPRTERPRLGPRSFTLSASKKRNHPPGEPGALVVLPGRPRRAAPIRNPKSKIRNPKSGFTLVELLVTITIITMLAGLVLGGLTMARNAAREMKTKATIAKLDEIILRMYAGYADRRMPISISGLNRDVAAARRLVVLRHIMRMEMPDRFANVTDPPLPDPDNPSEQLFARPALNMAYNGYLSGSPTATLAQQSAICLYMIIALAHPRELQHFSADEIGSVSVGTGSLPVFVDAWGNPICFLRWAPGFPDSDIQPPPGMLPTDPRFVRDPFDTRGVDPNAPKLVPLVFSAGPDGQYGIDAGPGWPNPTNPFIAPPDWPITGRPDGTGSHYDNIHNHRLEIR